MARRKTTRRKTPRKSASRNTDVKARSSVKPASSSSSRGAQPLLIESAWEVCHQLGGIYTVLRSKAPMMVERWGNRYCMLGPYHEPTAAVEFDPAEPTGPFGSAVAQLRDQGIEAHFGRWLVTGRPQTVLLDVRSAQSRLHEIKYRLWEQHGVATPGQDELIDRVIAFGELCRLFLLALVKHRGAAEPMTAHFHEWMAGGAAIPFLRRDNWPGSVVFTTHATILGRYIASNDAMFYEHLPYYDAAEQAVRFNIEPQHKLECAAAHGAHVFTTVSDVTARECTHLLGRNPDVLLPNGLNIQRFAAIHEFQNLHREYKERIHRFVIGHFFPSYSFDLERTLYFFISGRYEYRNKGVDLMIESLARLNHRLRETKSQTHVVAFLITRTPVKSINVNVLESNAMLRELEAAVASIQDEVGKNLFYAAATGKIPDLNKLMPDYYRLRLRRTIQAWRRNEPPSIITHDLESEHDDPILAQLRVCRLWNMAHDPVKVVYHPQFITPTNPLFGMEYDHFVRGCHLGVFPSYYEPWGYTPLESIALGVPAVTSDLSGFGSYLKQLLPDHEQRGLYVIDRHSRDFNTAAEQLADRMQRYCELSRRERIALRNNVESFSEHFDWRNLIRCYHEAHELALDRLAD